MLSSGEVTKLETGSIVLVKFHPGFGAEFEKYRPAVVVSRKSTDIDGRFCLIAPLTTNLEVKDKKTELIIKDNPHLEKDSLLLCWYLWTIDVRRIVRHLGKLASYDTEKVHEAVKYVVEP